MEHTKAPWRAGPVADTIIADEGCSNMSVEARAHYGGYLVAESVDAADRDFIVRACNSHEQLVAALRGLFDSYKRLADSGDAGNWSLEDLAEGKAAMAALAAAGAA